MDYTAQEVIGMIHYRKRDLLSATSSTAVAGIISMECFFWGIMKMADLVIIQIHVIFFLRLCSSNFRNVEIFFWLNKLTVMPCQRTIQPNLPKVQTLTRTLDWPNQAWNFIYQKAMLFVGLQRALPLENPEVYMKLFKGHQSQENVSQWPKIDPITYN